MKSYILTPLLAIAPVLAAPAGPGVVFVNNEWVTPSPTLQARAASTMICNQDNVLRALMNPTRSVGASAFCSNFIQPTTTTTTSVTATSTTGTTTVTSTTTTTTSTTSTTTTVPAATVICLPAPASAASAACGVSGDSTSDYLSSNFPASPAACRAACLANPQCNSFQTDGQGTRCLLHSLTYAQGIAARKFRSPSQFGYVFFDRACYAEPAPAACAAPSAPAKMAKREYTGVTPTYLATVPASRISSACSCLITAAASTATATATTTVSTTTSTVVVATQTSVTTIVTVETTVSTVSSGTTTFTSTAADPTIS